MSRTQYGMGPGEVARGAAPADQPESEGSTGTGVTLYRPIIVAILYLANLFTGFSVLIGLILAYVWRNDADVTEWEETHFTYLIRTFWIGFWLIVLMIFGMVGAALWSEIAGLLGDSAAANAAPAPAGPPPPVVAAMIFGGALIGFLLFIWYCVRSILSLANAANRRPMPKPKTWLF